MEISKKLPNLELNNVVVCLLCFLSNSQKRRGRENDVNEEKREGKNNDLHLTCKLEMPVPLT